MRAKCRAGRLEASRIGRTLRFGAGVDHYQQAVLNARSQVRRSEDVVVCHVCCEVDVALGLSYAERVRRCPSRLWARSPRLLGDALERAAAASRRGRRPLLGAWPDASAAAPPAAAPWFSRSGTARRPRRSPATTRPAQARWRDRAGRAVPTNRCGPARSARPQREALRLSA